MTFRKCHTDYGLSEDQSRHMLEEMDLKKSDCILSFLCFTPSLFKRQALLMWSFLSYKIHRRRGKRCNRRDKDDSEHFIGGDHCRLRTFATLDELPMWYLPVIYRESRLREGEPSNYRKALPKIRSVCRVAERAIGRWGCHSL